MTDILSCRLFNKKRSGEGRGRDDRGGGGGGGGLLPSIQIGRLSKKFEAFPRLMSTINVVRSGSFR
jgi:hypothetical protein